MKKILFLLLVVVSSTFAGAFSNPPVTLKQIADGFVSPIALVQHPGGALLVVDQIGTISVLKDGKVSEKLFLDARLRLVKLNNGFDERGLLGLAFHPKFTQNKKLYVFYSAPLHSSAPTNWNCSSRISEFKVSATNALEVDAASERVLLEYDKPSFNHNGGTLAFGPDGFLYASSGDGGGGNDTGLGHSPQGNGQDTSTLLGKILRIDVDTGNPYGIPKDNPFADGRKGRPEIFAYGLRNPWKFSFDRGGAHELFAGDVGQNLFEEVNIITNGGNYGWNIREGFHCFDPKNPNKPPENCLDVAADGKPLTPPILEYKNLKAFPSSPEARGVSVTGGYIYRGKKLPQLAGKYIFGDWTRNWTKPDGALMVATRPAGNSIGRWSFEQLALDGQPDGAVDGCLVALGEDNAGELYVMTTGVNAMTVKSGKIFKLVPVGK